MRALGGFEKIEDKVVALLSKIMSSGELSEVGVCKMFREEVRCLDWVSFGSILSVCFGSLCATISAALSGILLIAFYGVLFLEAGITYLGVVLVQISRYSGCSSRGRCSIWNPPNWVVAVMAK